jgi:hypothetical protein
VQSNSFFLITTNPVDLKGASGTYEYEVGFDPTQLPSSNYEALAANAGLISLMILGPNGWTPAVNANQEFPGSQAQLNYVGSYNSFTAANPSATVDNSVGSSGVYQAATGSNAWAVVDPSGHYVNVDQSGGVEYAVGEQVFTQQIVTITVS